ncbi:armadillo-type protein [Haematococcus lacustris]
MQLAPRGGQAARRSAPGLPWLQCCWPARGRGGAGRALDPALHQLLLSLVPWEGQGQGQGQSSRAGQPAGGQAGGQAGCECVPPSPLPPLGLPPLTALVYWLLLPVLSPGPAPPEALGLQLEAVACLRALLADQEQGQAAALQAGLLTPLLQLVREAELQLAWQSVEVVGTLAASAPLRQQLVDEGAVEALVELLQECGDALHLLTVRKQLAEHAVRGSSPASPAPHSAFAHPGQAAGAPGRRRVQLVGLQAVGVRGSACLYAPHAPGTLCDYCCPSACIRALLQLAGPAGGPPAPGGGRVLLGSRGSSSSGGGGAGAVCRPADVAARLSRCGALYCLFLLLHHELCGAHHSKLASSLVLLLNWMLASGLPLQDEVRKAGGLAILVALLQQAVGSSGITDIFQLRVLLCSALERCLAGNPANQLLAREHGLIPPLLALLGGAVEQQQLHVLDDDEQVAVAALELLAACCQGCSGNQAAVMAGGGLRLLHGLLTREHPGRCSPAVVCAAVRCLGFLVEGSQAAAAALMGGGALPRLVQAAEAAPDSPLAHCLVYTCIALVRHWPEGKARVLAAGLLPLLLRMLAAQAPACVMAAAQGLYCVCVGDVDLQNEVAAQGALQVLQGLLSGPAPLAVPAAWLACCLLHGNSYVKNAARQAGLPRLLVRAVRCAGLEQPQLTVACCHALAQLSSSNHANQEAVADEGGVEAVLLLLRALLRPGDPGTPAATPRQPARPPSSLPPTQPPPQTLGGPQGGPQGEAGTQGMEAASPPPADGSEGSASCPAPALAAGPVTPVKQQGGWGPGGAAAAVPLAVAKTQPAVLDAALRLLAALMEFNATNQQLARESGCLSLLTHLLLAAAAEPELGALRRAGLLPPLAAACAAVAAAAQDCEDNQQHLVQAHEDLAPALFRLLTVDEPYVALEVARALEFTAIRSDLVHDMREERVEFEADAVRSLVRVLHSRGPRSPAAASSSNGAVDSRRARNPADGLDPSAPPLVASEVVREAARVMLSIVAAVGGSSDASAGTGAVVDTKPGATAGTKLSAAFALFRRAKPSSGPPAGGGAAAVQEVAAALPPGTAQQPDASAAPAPEVPSLAVEGNQGGAVRPGAAGGEAAALALPPLPPSLSSLMQPLPASFASAAPAASSGPGRRTPAPSTLTGRPSSEALSFWDLGAGGGPLGSPLPQLSLRPEQWTWLAGKSAAAFQAVACCLEDGVWRAVKVQLAWLLFLLAAKSAANRELLARLERSLVSPLAQQLANAEAFAASAQAAAASSSSEAPRSAGQGIDAQVSASGSATAALPVSTLAHDSLQPAGSAPLPPQHARTPTPPSRPDPGPTASPAHALMQHSMQPLTPNGQATHPPAPAGEGHARGLGEQAGRTSPQGVGQRVSGSWGVGKAHLGAGAAPHAPVEAPTAPGLQELPAASSPLDCCVEASGGEEAQAGRAQPVMVVGTSAVGPASPQAAATADRARAADADEALVAGRAATSATPERATLPQHLGSNGRFNDFGPVPAAGYGDVAALAVPTAPSDDESDELAQIRKEAELLAGVQQA